MTTFNKKRDDVDQGDPKTYEIGKIGRKRRNLGDNKVDDTENVLKTDTCFVCDGEDIWVLVCHGEECPFAIHQSCASDEPDFDEFGNFYCPYCWYKRVVDKSVKLQKKLIVAEKLRKSRETLEGVDLGLMMGEVTEDVEIEVEVNVSVGRNVTTVNPSGIKREGDESYEKFMVMEKNQRMKEVAAETDSLEVSETSDDDVDEGREQRERFSEKNHETSNACTSNASEKIKGRARFIEKNHETSQAHSFDADVKTRKQRIYSEKIQKINRIASTRKRGVFINDEGTQASDSNLGEGRSGQGCYHEKNQQKKSSSTESCAQKSPRTDKGSSRGSALVVGRFRQGRQIQKKRHDENGTQEKKVSQDLERKHKGAVERDGDKYYFAEIQERHDQADMRNVVEAFSEPGNGFSKDELVERNYISSSISSPMSTDKVKGSNAASQELALIIHPMAGLQEQPIEATPIVTRLFCSASSKKLSFRPEKYGNKSYLEKNGAAASNDPGQRKFVLCSDRKRKRLFWTQAEEEMLRIGVQKYPGLRNIPWRKIVEYGRDVFHEARVPSDLKDKWKTMNKMSFDTGNWVNLSTEKQPNHS